MPGPVGIHLISPADIAYEQALIAEPANLGAWLQYYRHKTAGSVHERVFLLERAVRQFPRSYKFWTLYLDLRTGLLAQANPHAHARHFERVNALFERCLGYNHTLPMVWLRYLHFLYRQPDGTRTRQTFNRCLQSLPLSQHGLIWPSFLVLADAVGGPPAAHLYLRYFQYSPSLVQHVIERLTELGAVEESGALLCRVMASPALLYNPEVIDKSPLEMWSAFCAVAMEREGTIGGQDAEQYVENVVESGLARFPDQTSLLYVKLAAYLARRHNHLKAIDYFERGLARCLTVKDFTVIFDAYLAMLEEALERAMAEETQCLSKKEEEEELPHKEGEEEVPNKDGKDAPSPLDVAGEPSPLDVAGAPPSVNTAGASLVELQMVQFENLMDRRPFLLNDVLLRQNPHSVDDWLARFDLYGTEELEAMLGDMVRALTTIAPGRARGLHRVWLRYAGVYEANGDLATARVIFDRAIKVEFGSVEELVEVWHAWAEMEARRDFDRAVRVYEEALFVPHATKEVPPAVVAAARAVAYTDTALKPQQRVFKAVKLWSHYLDLLEAAAEDDAAVAHVCAAYESMLRLKIATPVVLVNYATFLESARRFEQSFAVYEKGVALFKFPVNYEIWNIYLLRVLARQSVVSPERIRDLFDQAISSCGAATTGEASTPLGKTSTPLGKTPNSSGSGFIKSIVLSYGAWELSLGFGTRAFRVYDRVLAQTVLEPQDRFELTQIYLKQAHEVLGNSVRSLYEAALGDEIFTHSQVWRLTHQLVELETAAGEFTRVRELFRYAAANLLVSLKGPTFGLWDAWSAFEVAHGSEASYKQMLRYKRSVQVGLAERERLDPSLLAGANGGVAFVTATETKPTQTKLAEVENPDEMELDLD